VEIRDDRMVSIVPRPEFWPCFNFFEAVVSQRTTKGLPH
jgi:hypothetical protein